LRANPPQVYFAGAPWGDCYNRSAVAGGRLRHELHAVEARAAHPQRQADDSAGEGRNVASAAKELDRPTAEITIDVNAVGEDRGG